MCFYDFFQSAFTFHSFWQEKRANVIVLNSFFTAQSVQVIAL